MGLVLCTWVLECLGLVLCTWVLECLGLVLCTWVLECLGLVLCTWVLECLGLVLCTWVLECLCLQAPRQSTVGNSIFRKVHIAWNGNQITPERSQKSINSVLSNYDCTAGISA